MERFRTVSFQKVVKHDDNLSSDDKGFRTVSFQKVVKLLLGQFEELEKF